MAPPVHTERDFVTHTPSRHSASKDLVNALVIPRPIAFVTSQNKEGVINGAPFSYFNIVCAEPLILSLSISRRNGTRKDTAANIFLKKEFVVNLCSVSLASAITLAGQEFPPEISEIAMAGLSLLPSQQVSVPRLANSLVHFECLLHKAFEIGASSCDLILAEVVQLHLHKDVLSVEGKVDIQKLNPLARLSGSTYASLGDFFSV